MPMHVAPCGQGILMIWRVAKYVPPVALAALILLLWWLIRG